MANYAITDIPDDEYENLRIICIKKGQTVAEVIRKMITNYVKKNKE